MIDVTMLGSSALMPLPDRALASAYICCSGRGILLDCGEGTQTALRRWGCSLLKTDLIALSHYHGDHIFGLPGLLQSMNALSRTEPLYITGPEGLESELEPILRLAGPLCYELHLLDIPAGGEIRLRSLNRSWPYEACLHSFNTRHRVQSQGYSFVLSRAGKFLPERARALAVPMACWGRLQRGESVEVEGCTVLPQDVMTEPRRGIKVVFSGDSACCDELRENARNAQLLILDATYGEDEQAELAEKYGHMNFAQAAGLAEASGAQRLWLTHYSPMIKNPEDYIENAGRYFPESCCAYDGMHIKLEFED